MAYVFILFFRSACSFALSELRLDLRRMEITGKININVGNQKKVQD